MVRTNMTMEGKVTAERGGGNQTASERVADLLKSDHDGAFKEKEADALKARMQWQPTKEDYREYVQHGHGTGHGPPIPLAPGGFSYVSVPDNHRVVKHTNEVPPEAQVKLDGPGSATKDWRTENSRIGRYWEHPNFQVRKYGTWDFNKSPEPAEGSNAFNSRLFTPSK